jgi:class 3 adenylate cyclase
LSPATFRATPPHVRHHRALRQGNAPENTDALRERLNKTTAAYSRFVPREFLNLLGIEDIRKVELGQQVERKMTILFCDIRNFTACRKP